MVLKSKKTRKSFSLKEIKAREILDSRGNPTIGVDLKTATGVFHSSVPSGASKGKYEAVELRDGEKRYFGKGVLKAVKNINEVIGPKIKGKDVTLQKEIDDLMIELDGTKDKSCLGANAICAVSLAVCRAGAGARKLKLFEYIRDIFKSRHNMTDRDYKIPFPLFNVINGGLHAGNRLDIQEFMIAPKEESFSKNLQIGAEIYHQLRDLLLEKYGKQATNLGDEGGFAPPLIAPEQAIELILGAARKKGYENKIKIILDVAASQFFKDGKYKMQFGIFTKQGLIRYYLNLISRYPVAGLEDPFSEDDWEGFEQITKELGEKVLVIGDDLLVTNPDRIKQAKEKKAVNSMILKINQVGTVSEALEAAGLAKDFGWKIIVSHRSGETNDDFIADLSVGLGADFIKTGALARGERVAKYNRLLKIEQELGL